MTTSNESGDNSFIPNDEEEDVMEYRIPELLKEFKDQYHDTVKRVYKMYSSVAQADHVIPHLDDPTRDFKENDFVSTLESLDEFVDRYHPMWKVDREVCFRSLSKENPEDGADLAAHVNKKWGQQTIDISQNMSHIVRATPPSNNTQSMSLSGAGYSHLEFNNAAVSSEELESEEKSDIERKYEYLCSIDIQTLKDEVLEKENVRLNRFKALQNNSNSVRKGIDNGDDNHRGEQMFNRDQVERLVKAEGERRKWGVERTAQAVIGVHDIFDTKKCYNNSGRESTIPRSHVDEILGMEEAYNMVCQVYTDH